MKKIWIVLISLLLISCQSDITQLNKDALKYIRMGNYTEALSILNEALTIDDEDDVTWNNISVCYEGIGEYQLALDAAQMAVNNGREKAAEYANLGNAYFDLGQVDEARISYTRALEIEDDYFFALYGMGVYYIEMEEYEKSLEYFTELYDNNPMNLDVVRYIAFSNFKMGKVDAAIAYLEGELEKINSVELEQLLELMNDYRNIDKE